MKANLSNRPSISRIREVLDYDRDSGVLTWKVTSGRAYEGKEAGCLDKKNGYIRVRVDGHFILAHHIGFAIHHGFWPERLDHKHGKGAGNGIKNLRECTQSQNMGNSEKPSHNTSGLKGVSFHKETNKWQAQIRVRGKSFYLGVHDTKELAHQAYAVAAANHFGEFAKAGNRPSSAPRAPQREAAPRRRPTITELRSKLVYDPESGDLRWGVAGRLAGRLMEDGYIRVGIFGRGYQAHVVIWALQTGAWPTLVIHHKDRNRANNRWRNLEETTQSENIKAAYVHMRAGTVLFTYAKRSRTDDSVGTEGNPRERPEVPQSET